MQRRNISGRRSDGRRSDGRRSDGRRSESILLYGFGLALTLSLAFNGFLLHEQSRHQLISYEYGNGKSDQSVDTTIWQQQLSDCAQASAQKDSLIHWLEHTPSAPPGRSAVIQRTRNE